VAALRSRRQARLIRDPGAPRETGGGCSSERSMLVERKRERGGLRPDGRVGSPRRGERSGEHRPRSTPNSRELGTDARSEQRSEAGARRLLRCASERPDAESSGAWGSALLSRSVRGNRPLVTSSRWLVYRDVVADVACHWQSRRAISQDVCSPRSTVWTGCLAAGATVARPELVQRHESIGRREAQRLAAREKLWRPKPYGRMWGETNPQGPGGIKPSRGWETLRTDGVGEVNRHVNDRPCCFRRKGTNPREGVVGCPAACLPCGPRPRSVSPREATSGPRPAVHEPPPSGGGHARLGDPERPVNAARGFGQRRPAFRPLRRAAR